jgi:serine/threonine protein kinase
MYDCIHDFEKGTLYLIMEYIEGETIEDYTLRILNENTGFITESVVKNIFNQIVQAVEILHEHGICHRDLKPDNLLYNSKTGNIKLMDFNISKRFKHDVIS